MYKVVAWVVTTLLIPIVVFAYQRFSDDVRLRQSIESEISVIEFEIAARLGQVSSSFIALVALDASPRQFREQVTSGWLESTIRQLRESPNVNMATPVGDVRILATFAAATTKDMTLLGLFARGTYLHLQMLDFFELSLIDRVVLRKQVPANFCTQKIQEGERRVGYLKSEIQRGRPPDSQRREFDIADWRPSASGVDRASTACLKAWKYREGIASLLTPERFAFTPNKDSKKEELQRNLLIKFDREFYRKLLSTVPDFDLPYVDVFAG